MPCFGDYEVGWSSYYSESAYVACVAGFMVLIFFFYKVATFRDYFH